MSRRTFVIVVVVLIAAILFLTRNGAPVSPPPPTAAPHSVNTPNGVVQVPGTAYIEAFDPATNSNIDAINVRSEARSAQPPTCTLSDGDRLTVSDDTRADSALWLYVTSGNCRGWVLADFVTPDR